jgi:D-sedoheptulose 7-phosphate isomerase
MGRMLATAVLGGAKVLFCGNGGSAADAQHAAAELVGRFYEDRMPLAAISLTTDTSILTAVGNDWQFDDIFARQVQALGHPGDVLVGMTTSGRSKNVVRALEVARQKGMKTLALTGSEGRDVATVADLCLRVPDTDTPRIQELHILALHSICEIVEATVVAQIG